VGEEAAYHSALALARSRENVVAERATGSGTPVAVWRWRTDRGRALLVVEVPNKKNNTNQPPKHTHNNKPTNKPTPTNQQSGAFFCVHPEDLFLCAASLLKKKQRRLDKFACAQMNDRRDLV